MEAPDRRGWSQFSPIDAPPEKSLATLTTLAAAEKTQARRTPSDDTMALFDAAWDHFFGAVRRARARVARERSSGLTLAQYQLIAPLYESEALPVGAVAFSAGIATPTATRMLDVLTRAGFVERRQSEVDRRVVTVRLTPRGRRLVRTKRDLIAQKRRTVYESLSQREREQAVALLGRLADLIEEL